MRRQQVTFLATVLLDVTDNRVRTNFEACLSWGTGISIQSIHGPQRAYIKVLRKRPPPRGRVTMVIKTEVCGFSDTRVYPGHGVRFVRRDGQVRL